MENSHKLYILVDKTLTPSQQAVQACHAAIEFALKYPEWKHQSLVILGVKGEQELIEWWNKVAHHETSGFFESYYDRFTAVACHGCDEEVKSLNLL